MHLFNKCTQEKEGGYDPSPLKLDSVVLNVYSITMANVKWSDCLGPPYTKKPTLTMLTEGEYHNRNVGLRDGPKTRDARVEIHNVLYDRDYVLGWLNAWIGPFLREVGEERLVSLLREIE